MEADVEYCSECGASLSKKNVYEGWATCYDETNNFLFDKVFFLYTTKVLAEDAASRGSYNDQKRLIGGRARKIRVEILE